MSDDLKLTEFAINLQQEVISRASLEDQEEFLGDAFTRIMIDYLAEAGEWMTEWRAITKREDLKSAAII